MGMDSGFTQLVGGRTGLPAFLAHWHIGWTIKFTRNCSTRHPQKLCLGEEMTQNFCFSAEDHDDNCSLSNSIQQPQPRAEHSPRHVPARRSLIIPTSRRGKPGLGQPKQRAQGAYLTGGRTSLRAGPCCAHTLCLCPGAGSDEFLGNAEILALCLIPGQGLRTKVQNQLPTQAEGLPWSPRARLGQQAGPLATETGRADRWQGAWDPAGSLLKAAVSVSGPD